MANLTAAILDLPEVQEHFTQVERPFGPCLLHKTLPIWIVEYDHFPWQKQPKHWAVYFAVDPTEGRDPWTVNNRNLSAKRYDWIDPKRAVAEALAKANAWPHGRAGYE